MRQILLVDDEANLRHLLRLVLEEEGFEVAEAGSLSEARATLERKAPHLVVTDLAVFDFASPDRRMRLRSLHPGATLEQVLDNMSFRPVVPHPVPQTPAPDARQLDLIRRVIDPQRVLLKV